MALTFPLTLGQFASGLQIESIDFHLQRRVETSGLGTGMLIVAQNGPDFWTADIKIRPLYNKDARGLQALINSLDGGMNDFYLYDPVAAYPVSDPGGSILGSATITNTAVNNNGIVMDFSGFPNNYLLSPGDMFSFDYGAGNAYRALHQVVVGGQAGSGGNIANVEFRPRLDDPNLNTGKTMTFKKASARMKIVNDSIEYGSRQDIFTSGIAFTCEQVP